ncbi:MAG: alpha/beta hydrolase [Chloroflexi bacterium]|nr:alpha/beta hydrolase [Chloroflexota bacterium]
MTTDLRVQEYEIAERRLFQKYGLEYRSHYFQLDNPHLRARVIEVGSGPPVLFVHGGGGVASGWVPLLPEIKGYRLLAVDRPGCGLTDGFNYRGSEFRPHAVSFLERILDALHLKTVPIVANSMGGLWSFWLALERPERVSAMAQLGCPALILDTGAPFPMRLLSVRGLNQLMFSLQRPSVKMVKGVFKNMGHKMEAMERLPGEYWECMFRSGMLPVYKEGWLTIIERVLRVTGPAPGLSLREDELRRVAQPTLFVWGDNDAFGKPEVGRRAVQVMPKAKLEVVPGGHLPWLDEPKRVGELVSGFLSQNAGNGHAQRQA